MATTWHVAKASQPATDPQLTDQQLQAFRLHANGIVSVVLVVVVCGGSVRGGLCCGCVRLWRLCVAVWVGICVCVCICVCVGSSVNLFLRPLCSTANTAKYICIALSGRGGLFMSATLATPLHAFQRSLKTANATQRRSIDVGHA